MTYVFVVIDSTLHYSTIPEWDDWMKEEKKKKLIPDDIPIIWVNII